MRTTVTLDEALLGRAGALSGVQDRSALLAEALRALIERESARRLARLGGSEPQLEAAPSGVRFRVRSRRAAPRPTRSSGLAARSRRQRGPARLRRG